MATPGCAFSVSRSRSATSLSGARAPTVTDTTDRPPASFPVNASSMLEALTGKLAGGRSVVSVTVGARAPESDVADLLRETEKAHPGVAIGSYPFFKDGGYGSNFVIRSEDGELAKSCGDALSERLREAGYEPVDGGI